LGPEEAALAVELLDVKRVVPCHFGTFPPLVGRPEELAERVGADVTVERIDPGGTVTI
jgi:L-ascorbate metabolism protein UlaG (beta-lactamase superfamily)